MSVTVWSDGGSWPALPDTSPSEMHSSGGSGSRPSARCWVTLLALPIQPLAMLVRPISIIDLILPSTVCVHPFYLVILYTRLSVFNLRFIHVSLCDKRCIVYIFIWWVCLHLTWPCSLHCQKSLQPACQFLSLWKRHRAQSYSERKWDCIDKLKCM